MSSQEQKARQKMEPVGKCNRCGNAMNLQIFRCTGCRFSFCEKCYKEVHPPNCKGHVPIPQQTPESKGAEITNWPVEPWCATHPLMPLDYVWVDNLMPACCKCLAVASNRCRAFIRRSDFNSFLDNKIKILIQRIETFSKFIEPSSVKANASGAKGVPEAIKADADATIVDNPGLMKSTFDTMNEVVDKRHKSMHKEIDKKAAVLEENIDKRKDEFEQLFNLWTMIHAVKTTDPIGPITPKLCGAMNEIEKLLYKFRSNPVMYVIEAHGEDSQVKLLKRIQKLGNVKTVKKTKMEVIPTCSYNSFVCLQQSFLNSAVEGLRIVRDRDYKDPSTHSPIPLMEHYPIISEIQKWVRNLPLMCICNVDDLVSALHHRGFWEVKKIIK